MTEEVLGACVAVLPGRCGRAVLAAWRQSGRGADRERGDRVMKCREFGAGVGDRWPKTLKQAAPRCASANNDNKTHLGVDPCRNDT